MELSACSISTKVGSIRLNWAALLWSRSRSRATFRDCLLPVKNRRRNPVVVVTGKAAFDSNARFSGYRGVDPTVTAAKLAEERLSHLARFDSLTDLPNGRCSMIASRKPSPRRRRTNRGLPFCVSIWTNSNTSMTHSGMGSAIACWPKSHGDCGPASATAIVVARLAGDEFAILRAAAARDRASRLAARIVRGDRRTRADRRHQTSPCASASALRCRPAKQLATSCTGPISPLSRKKRDETDFRFYDAEMDAKSKRGARWPPTWRGALERGEFLCTFSLSSAAQSLKTAI